jgi:hypothetical protein
MGEAKEYKGNYVPSMFDAAKRYRMQFQKSVPLSSNELIEIQDVSDTFVRQLISNNFPRGSSINDGFKVIESVTDNTNNFTILGGDGTVNGAGVLFVDGYILFLKNSIEFKDQNASLTLIDDSYTKSLISAATTPVAPRIDQVYVDFYFAEVSANSTSEYEDTSLIVTGIGTPTANRVRMVQDICIAEGTTIPTDGYDSVNIYHRYIKIATLNRTATDQITNAMIVDERIKVNSVASYSLGTTVTDLVLADGSNIGDDTHRISSIFMGSEIDYANDLVFKSTTEKIRFSTSGNIGIATTSPNDAIEIYGTNKGVRFTSNAGANNASIFNDGSNIVTKQPLSGSYVIKKQDNTSLLTVLPSGFVGIGVTNPTHTLQVAGDALITSNLTVNGITTIVNTEVTTATMMSVEQDDDQIALNVEQITPGTTATVMTIRNAGDGLSLDTQGYSKFQNSIGINATPEDALPSFVPASNWLAKLLTIQCDDSNGFAALNLRNDIGENSLIWKQGSTRTLTGSDPGSLVIDNMGKPIVFAQSLQSKMIIDSNGLVGIGTTPTVWPFDVANYINISSTSPNQPFYLMTIDGGNARAAINAGIDSVSGSGYFTIRTNPSGGSTVERVRVSKDGYVGIGTTNPLDRLHVVSGGALFSGNVGIGTTSQLAKLHVEGSTFLNGDVQIGSSPTGSSVIIQGTQTWKNSSATMFAASRFTSDALQIGPIAAADTPHLQFMTNNNVKLHIDKLLTRIGIGTTTPTCALHVEGDTYIHGSLSVSGSFGLIGDNYVLGSFGIGTTLPTTKLDVIGATRMTSNLMVEGNSTDSYIATGNVGIGTTLPLVMLDVRGAFSNTGNISSTGVFTVTGSGNHYISNGNVGIGTTNPLYKLHINGTTYSDQDLHVGPNTVIGSYANPSVFNTDVGINLAAQARTVPTAALDVVGDIRVSNNLYVNGTTTITNTEITTTDMMSIQQGDDQVALDVQQTLPSATATVMKITNAGSGYALTIDSGNVGIGTTSPAEPLHIYGPGYTQQLIETTDSTCIASVTLKNPTGYAVIAKQGSTAEYAEVNSLVLVNSHAAPITFKQSTNERMRIHSDGNVGIGTTIPGAKLDVRGNINSTGDLTVSGSGTHYISSGNVGIGTTASAYPLRVQGNAIFTGNVGIGTTSLLFATRALTLYGSSGLQIAANYGADDWSITSDANGLNFVDDSAPATYLTIKKFVSGDDVTGRVGIGTTAPSQLLEISRDIPGAGGLPGNGVWTSVQNRVKSAIVANDDIGGYKIRAQINNVSDTYIKDVVQITAVHGTTPATPGALSPRLEFRLYNNVSGDTFDSKMTITNHGAVGIGTISPAATFDVEGDITLPSAELARPVMQISRSVTDAIHGIKKSVGNKESVNPGDWTEDTSAIGGVWEYTGHGVLVQASAPGSTDGGELVILPYMTGGAGKAFAGTLYYQVTSSGGPYWALFSLISQPGSPSIQTTQAIYIVGTIAYSDTANRLCYIVTGPTGSVSSTISLKNNLAQDMFVTYKLEGSWI